MRPNLNATLRVQRVLPYTQGYLIARIKGAIVRERALSKWSLVLVPSSQLWRPIILKLIYPVCGGYGWCSSSTRTPGVAKPRKSRNWSERISEMGEASYRLNPYIPFVSARWPSGQIYLGAKLICASDIKNILLKPTFVKRTMLNVSEIGTVGCPVQSSMVDDTSIDVGISMNGSAVPHGANNGLCYVHKCLIYLFFSGQNLMYG